MAESLLSGASSAPESGMPGGSIDTLLLRMDKRQQQHGEILIEIVKLLRPSDDKPGAGDLVKELISRIDRQTAMLRSLLALIAQLGKDLPSSVVAVLHDAETEGDEEVRSKIPQPARQRNGKQGA